MVYAGYKEIPDFYNRVRNLVGANSETTTDESLDFPEKAPMAEDMAKSKVPNWELLTDEQSLIFEKIVVIQTALIIYSQIRNFEYKIKQTTSMKIEYRDVDFDFGNHLQSMLDMLINQLAPIESEFIGFDISQ